MMMMIMIMIMMNCFSGMVDERLLALFPARIIVRDAQHRECPTRGKQGLNQRITRVQA